MVHIAGCWRDIFSRNIKDAFTPLVSSSACLLCITCPTSFIQAPAQFHFFYFFFLVPHPVLEEITTPAGAKISPHTTHTRTHARKHTQTFIIIAIIIFQVFIISNIQTALEGAIFLLNVSLPHLSLSFPPLSLYIYLAPI